MHDRPRPLALIILDGWGYREEVSSNAIALAHKPNWNSLWANYTRTLISGSGRCVGLPQGQMGNSEVGHLNMGAGRVVHQDFTRITKAIEDRTFFNNSVFQNALDQTSKIKKNVHILGLLSDGGVHSHRSHIAAMIQLAHEFSIPNIFVHAFLDGRDTPPKSAEESIQYLQEECKTIPNWRIASLIGRYYAMDRDKRWERVEKAYNLLTQGKADFIAQNAIDGLQAAYSRGETDEFIQPTRILPDQNEDGLIQDEDLVIFMNFRADRARELTHALIDRSFTGFKREVTPTLGIMVTLTEYDKQFAVQVAFKPERLDNILGAYLSQHNMTQLRIAETEKYAHVTFFFNGGVETPFSGEERLLIPSPKVATYDLKPQMSAIELTESLVKAIQSHKYDVIICNFANPDMVGHTGNLAATIKAIETIDDCLGKIIDALRTVNGEAIITSDHGNAEKMFNTETGQPHTAHTAELVPFVYYGKKATITKTNGILSDIAPTMLYLLGLEKPMEMTGESILKLESQV